MREHVRVEITVYSPRETVNIALPFACLPPGVEQLMMRRAVAPFPESSPASLQSHESACPGPLAGPRDFVHPLGASPAYLSFGSGSRCPCWGSLWWVGGSPAVDGARQFAACWERRCLHFMSFCL